MTARRLVAIAVAGAALGAGASIAAAEQITAVGTGQAVPTPKDRDSDGSIRAAVATATASSTARALVNAQVQAQSIAAAAGLVLGPATEVEQQAGFFYVYNPMTQKLGPNRFCGVIDKRTVRRVEGRRIIRTRTVRDCYVPPFVTTTLSVTFDAARAR